MNYRVTKKLDEINRTLENILGVMQKPENKIIRFLEIAGLVSSAISILYSIYTIRNWIIGG